MICAQGQQRTTKGNTFCTHLWCLIPFYNTLQCSLSLLQPFLTFSDAFRPFVTFLDFALFNTLPDCVAFSGKTLFTWLVHHSVRFSGIILSWLALRFTNILRFILLLQLYLCFLLPPLPNRTESSPFDCTTVYWPQILLHRLLSPFLELRCTVSTDLLLTWTTFSDHFWVPYHYIYTHILLPFHRKRLGGEGHCFAWHVRVLFLVIACAITTYASHSVY